MAIIAKAEAGSNIPVHADGQFTARCIDVIDRGEVETTWQGRTQKKHKITIRFFCGEWFENNEGKDRPLWVDGWFTLTLGEKGKLRPFLESWRGRNFSIEELDGFDVENLIGAGALLVVVHNKTPDKTYANIKSVQKLMKGLEAPDAPEGYVRVCDRPTDEHQNGSGGVLPAYPDDDLPF